MRDRLSVAVVAAVVACAALACIAEVENPPARGGPGSDAGGRDATTGGDAALRDAPDAIAPVEAGDAALVVDASAPDGAPDADAALGDADVVTLDDPAPTATQPGKTTCAGCPDVASPQLDIDAGSSTSHTYTGTVTGAEGSGTFYVVRNDPDGGSTPFMTGPIPTTPGTGEWNVTVPLFCGEQILKAVWTNASGKLVVVTRVVTATCVEPEIRVTLTWDAIGRDWELHLVRPGGRINDTTGLSDCTWNTCIRQSPDWGAPNDTTDNPRKDVDSTGAYGPENILLAKPENGRFTLMVEHWSSSGAATSNGIVIVNVRGKPTLAFAIQHLAPLHVWTPATIDWPSATVTPVGSDLDCSETWSSGCTAVIP